MGSKKRDDPAIEESRQVAAPAAANSRNTEDRLSANRSPDLRRRALIAGLASTPVLLSLTNRSALGQTNANCSLLHSVTLGGSVHDMPNGWEQKDPNYIREQYEQHCIEGAKPGTANATGNGNTSQGTGNRF